MSVRERAKAYEDSVARSTIIEDSSPPRKISREELCGSHENSYNIESNVSEGRPTPPPRRGKKKGDNNSSPQTERKENIVDPVESRSRDNGKNHSSVQPTIIVSKRKKQGPPPPPPPRGSSLGRNSKCEQTATVKKPRPPIPPKPKNYFPKVVPKSDKVGSLSGTVNDVKKKRVGTTSVPSAASESVSSQFFVAREKQKKQAEQSSNLRSTQVQDEPKEPQVFYTSEEPKQIDSLSSEETTTAKEQQCNGQCLRQKGEQGKEGTSTIGYFDNLSSARKSTFKSYVKFTDKGYSTEETIDSLEGLEVHDVPVDYNAEDSEAETFESIRETKINIVVNGTSETKPCDVLPQVKEAKEHLTLSEATKCTTDEVNVASTETRQEENITDVKGEVTECLSCEDSSNNTSVTMDNMLESPDQGNCEQLTENSGHLRVHGEGSSFGETENISEQSRSNSSHLPVDEILAEEVVGERIGNGVCKETCEHPDKSFQTTSDEVSKDNHEKAKGNEDLEITESLVLASRGSTETNKEILEKESEDIRKHALDKTVVVTDNSDPGCENSEEQFGEEVVHPDESSELREEPTQGNDFDEEILHKNLCSASSHKDFESSNHETLIEVSSEEMIKDLQLPKLDVEDEVSVVEERENGKAVTVLSAKEHLEKNEATFTEDNPFLKEGGSIENQDEMSVKENEIIAVPKEDSKLDSVSAASTSEPMLEHVQPIDKEIETVSCENGIDELKSVSKEDTTLLNIETVSNIIQKGDFVENFPLEVEPYVKSQAVDVDVVTEIEGGEKESIRRSDEKMELEEEKKVEIEEGLDQGSGDLITEQSVDETRTVVYHLYEERSKEAEQIIASAEEKIHEADLSETQGLGECSATEEVINKQSENERRTVVGHVCEEITQEKQVIVASVKMEGDLSETQGLGECSAPEEVINKQSENERRTVVGHVCEEITQEKQVIVASAEMEGDLSETQVQEECNVTGESNSDDTCRVEESLPAELENEAGLQEDKVTELPEEEGGTEPGSPVSPQPVRPERPSRQAKLQKPVNEEAVFVNDQHIKGSSPVSDRKVQPSGYETVTVVLTPVTRPIPLKEDETVYKVPSTKYSVESDLVEESKYSVPPRKVSHNSEYAIPKPIFVQASQVPDNIGGSLEVYAVPGVTTHVPVVETPTQSWRNEESVYATPKENDVINAVLCSQKSLATAHNVSPPKPPRTCLPEETNTIPAGVAQDIVGVEVKLADPPKPLPRSRVSPGAATPEVQPRRGSPSPAPRKISKTSQNESDNADTVVVEGSGSPVPAPRSRVTAVDSDSLKELVQQAKENIATVGVKMTEESPRCRALPPPRPPPPLSRVSIISHDNDVPPISPGFEDNLDSDSDSDVGEVPVSKTPSKPKTYHIAHEILSTEQTFVDALKLVFEECYGTIKAANVVAESVLGDIFRDLENIYMLDSRFLQELEERMKTWEEQERIGDIIKKYGHFLKMYTTYVKSYDKAMGVFQETMKENPEFANLVAKFQASERCHGMQLSAYMLKPVQRIPSYRLLLIDYLKHLPKDSEEFKDTEATLKIVSEVATHINESMKKMDSFEQLLKIQSMLVGHPEIVKAGRDFLKEGTLMKVCRKDMQERRFFLLTDVLLYTTPVGINQYKLNKTLPLLGMQVTVPDSPDFVNEFSIISTTRSFTLTASTPEERDEWIEDLNKAIDVVTKRKITFVSKTKDVLPEQNEDVKLGEKAPVWIPDARVTMCMNCTSPFTLTNRRHHCRACGKVVCGTCSDCTAPLAYLDFVQARVCDKCYDLLLKEFHTDEINIDTEAEPLPPLLQESEDAEKYLKKPTKFELTRRFKSRKTKKRKSQLMHPSHLTEVVGNEVGSQMSGYLRCKKGRSGWKRSWFVLKDRVLYAYKASSDVVALESVPVLGYKVDDLGKDEDDFLFNLSHKGIAPLAFKADNETSATRWIQELKKAVIFEDL